jgi:hypothetical protein
MSYNISELNTLFYNYLQYSEFLLDISIEYNIAIISTTFDNMGTSYVLKNNNSIIQSINIPILSQHFKIRNEKNEDLDYSYSNNINYEDFENYIIWFSLFKE